MQIGDQCELWKVASRADHLLFPGAGKDNNNTNILP
jgi:hypothetical protein